MLSNDLLRTQLQKSGYYKSDTTPGLWSHTWRPIQFFLILDDFGIKHVRNKYALHFLKFLEQNYEITSDWEGKKSSGMDLGWNYDEYHTNITCCISMHGYIDKLLMKYGHSRPSKSQISPHKHCEVTYGAKEQLTTEEGKSPPLDKEVTKRIQGIVGALL